MLSAVASTAAMSFFVTIYDQSWTRTSFSTALHFRWKNKDIRLIVAFHDLCLDTNLEILLGILPKEHGKLDRLVPVVQLHLGKQIIMEFNSSCRRPDRNNGLF